MAEIKSDWEVVARGAITGGCELRRTVIPGGWIYHGEHQIIFVPEPPATAPATAPAAPRPHSWFPGPGRGPAKPVLPSVHRFAGEKREPYRGPLSDGDVVIDARFELPPRPKSVAEVIDTTAADGPVILATETDRGARRRRADFVNGEFEEVPKE